MSTLASFLSRMSVPHIVVAAEEYTGDYNTAPDMESGAPLHNVCLNGIFPADLYSGRGHEYAYSPEDRESLGITLRAHNKPWAPVTIYRAIPSDVKPARINKGDWVTLSRSYAKEHGESNVPGKFKIVSMRAHARDLYTTGDLAEWGYYPREGTDEETDTLKRRRHIAEVKRLLSAASNPTIMLNKYPNDPYYGKTEEFFRELAETKAKDYGFSAEDMKEAGLSLFESTASFEATAVSKKDKLKAQQKAAQSAPQPVQPVKAAKQTVVSLNLAKVDGLSDQFASYATALLDALAKGTAFNDIASQGIPVEGGSKLRTQLNRMTENQALRSVVYAKLTDDANNRHWRFYYDIASTAVALLDIFDKDGNKIDKQQVERLIQRSRVFRSNYR